MDSVSRVRLVGDPGRIGVATGRTTERGGRPFAQVMFPDRTDWVPKDQLELIPDVGEAPIDLLRRGRLARPADLYRTLAHIRLSGKLANYIYSLDTTDTDFYAYQFKPVVKLLQSVSPGILIADEVGLGKTIEAGLIWTELRSRFDLQKLLVVCPAMLRDKWVSELGRRFGVAAQRCDAAELVQLFEDTAAGDRSDFAAVVSLQGIRGSREVAAFLEARQQDGALIDLLVVDEAHYLRNPQTRSFDTAQALREASQFAVLLSATPVHLRSDDLFQLLRLVDENVFFRKEVFESVRRANEHLVQLREEVIAGRIDGPKVVERLGRALANPLLRENRQLGRLLSDAQEMRGQYSPRERVELASRLDSANLLGLAVTRTRRRDVKELRAVREAKTLVVQMNAVEEKFYNAVTTVVREYCAAADRHEGFLLVMPQRQASSCLVAALSHWREGASAGEAELYEDLGFEIPRAERVPVGPLVEELSRRTEELGNLTDLARGDTKYERLRDELRQFFREKPDEKVVVFSSFRQTLRYLARRLEADGFSCSLLLGGGSDSQQVLEEFANVQGSQILLSSSVGSEGIDLQFAWVLVNYDLPWNPMQVEQRIGRLDRLGQKSPKIAVWNLVHANTIDERIYERLLLRLEVFTRTLGGLEPVLGPKISDLALGLLRDSLTPEQEAARIDQTALALEGIRAHEAELEEEAVGLVAYGDFILEQVSAAREMSRRITVADIRRYVIDALSEYYPGSSFVEDSLDSAIVEVDLSPAAKHAFVEFLHERRVRAVSGLTRADPAPIRCRFDNGARSGHRRDEEVINQFHPVVRFVTQLLGGTNRLLYPAVAAQIRRDLVPTSFSGNVYRMAVARWTFDPLPTAEQLWFGVDELEPRAGDTPSAEDAERFVMALALHGEDWASVEADIDVEKLAREIEQGLLVEARRQFEEHGARVSDRNLDRADAQLRSLDAHLERQRAKYAEIRRRHLERGNPGLAKAQERNIERLGAQIGRRRLVIEEHRILRPAMQEICVGVVRVR